MYIDRRGAKRHKAIVNIAKTIREHSNNTIQTSIRTGKNDFLLRKRTKGSDTPWMEIPPIIITQEIPQFEVGTYKDILNPENNPDNEPDEPMDNQPEGIDEILQDIRQQEEIIYLSQPLFEGWEHPNGSDQIPTSLNRFIQVTEINCPNSKTKCTLQKNSVSPH